MAVQDRFDPGGTMNDDRNPWVRKAIQGLIALAIIAGVLLGVLVASDSGSLPSQIAAWALLVLAFIVVLAFFGIIALVVPMAVQEMFGSDQDNDAESGEYPRGIPMHFPDD